MSSVLCRLPSRCSRAAGPLVALAALVWATPAAAAIAGPTTFAPTGAEQTYSVPANVKLLAVLTIGAEGGGGSYGQVLGGYLPTTGGQPLYVEVGQNGAFNGGATFGGGGAAGAYPSCAGSCPANTYAASGGGASDVRTCSESAASCTGGSSEDSRLIVAGGGSGAGGNGSGPGFYCTQLYEAGNGYNAQPLPGGNPIDGPVPIPVAAGLVIPGQPASDTYGVEGDATAAQGGSTTPGAGGSLSTCSTGSPTVSAVFSPTVAGVAAGGPAGAAGASITGTSYAAPEGPSGYLPGAGGGGGGGYTGGGGGSAGYVCTHAAGGGPCYNPSPGQAGGGGASFVSNEIISPFDGGGVAPPEVVLAPTVEVDSPTNGAAYAPGAVVDAQWSCDAGGPAPFQGTSCTATDPSGSPIDTTPGTHTFTVEASVEYDTSDIPVTVTYTVAAPPPATTLAAPPQLVVFPPRRGAGLGTVEATLASAMGPVAGATIVFHAGRTELCTAVTAAGGTATCKLGLGEELAVLLGNSYTASFAATSGYGGSSATTAAIVARSGAASTSHSGAVPRPVTARGTASRGRTVYAVISGRSDHGALSLAVRKLRPIPAGRYTLRIAFTGARDARVSRTVTAVIG